MSHHCIAIQRTLPAFFALSGLASIPIPDPINLRSYGQMSRSLFFFWNALNWRVCVWVSICDWNLFTRNKSQDTFWLTRYKDQFSGKIFNSRRYWVFVVAVYCDIEKVFGLINRIPRLGKTLIYHVVVIKGPHIIIHAQTNLMHSCLCVCKVMLNFNGEIIVIRDQWIVCVSTCGFYGCAQLGVPEGGRAEHWSVSLRANRFIDGVIPSRSIDYAVFIIYWLPIMVCSSHICHIIQNNYN